MVFNRVKMSLLLLMIFPILIVVLSEVGIESYNIGTIVIFEVIWLLYILVCYLFFGWKRYFNA